MDYELPTEFDIIVVGTGIVESIVSAAASRIGKRVLHIDNNPYYGGLWASFNLDTIEKISNPDVPNKEWASDLVSENETFKPLGNSLFGLKDFQVEWHIPEAKAEASGDAEPETVWTRESLLKESRKYNLDLAPKLQFARGDFVELLISSNIARYSEYRSVSRVLTVLNDQLEVVPCSRSDVFANNKVSVIEKRILMKLFMALDSENAELENKTFRSFLKEKKLTPNLIHYVLYAIAMGHDEMPCSEGIKNTKRFMNSLGRFGKTPFLFSMYGSGEITQGFCRLSAVFGGIYALNQPLTGLVFKEGDLQGMICGKQKISADSIVMGVENAPSEYIKQSPNSYISRAIFITNRSILTSEKEHLTLLIYPPQDCKNSITLLELGSLTGTCPKDLYLVHMISKQVTTPKEDFSHCVQNLFIGDDKPKILWSCYFSIPDSNNLTLDTVDKCVLCPGPDSDLDYDNSVEIAKRIFLEVCPECEFLPRAPDPEEIIIEGDSEEGVPLTAEGENHETDLEIVAS